MMDLKNPVLLGPVQNQEHHMNGAIARRNNFNEHIPARWSNAMEFAQLTGRRYGLFRNTAPKTRTPCCVARLCG